MRPTERVCRCVSLGLLLLLCVATATVSPAQTFTTLFRFNGTNGDGPLGPLVQGFDANLYGVTIYGGAYDQGTVFKMTTKGALTMLHNFCAQFQDADGCQPYAGLVQARDGNLYGTTVGGGANASSTGGGTVFKISPTGALTALHEFCAQASCLDGASPWVGLVQATNGSFYGATVGGGAHGNGEVFKISATGAISTLYSFCALANCTDGVYPYGALIQGRDGNLYGTTSGGGANGRGTVFKLTLSGTFTTLYSFCAQVNCADGATPYGALVQASDGNFYGTTNAGGSNGTNSAGGTVFKITSQGVLTTLYTFCSQANCTDGGNPTAGLVQATDSNFYGATDAGGTYGHGTLFKITAGGALTSLHSFSSAGRTGALVQATDGNFYGAKFGKAVPTNAGAIFKLGMGLGPFVETLPTSGKAGAKVIILGTNLTGASAVSFNGIASPFTMVSSTEITTTVPSGATTGRVTVTIPTGTLSSNVVFVVHL